ncbi:unnamed protein product, partial [Pylaiella littoralis]
QIDDLDKRLRQEQECSRRLRSAVSVLMGKLTAAEEGRRRSNALERAFFCHLAEMEALVLQRDRLVAPGADETRAGCLEAARSEAHERLALALREELQDNSCWRRGTDIEAQTREVTSTAANPTATTARGQGTPQIDDSPHGMNNQEHRSSYAPGPTETNASSSPAPATGRLQDPVREDPKIRKDNQDHRRRQRSEDLPLRPRGGTQQGNEAGSTAATASPASCWESDAVMQAYRTAAARTVRRLSSALFGRELLAVEAARTSAAEREMMLEGRARALLDSQVSLQVEKDQLESLKDSFRVEVREAKKNLEKAREKNRQQRDMVKDAERVHSRLSWRILSMQVKRDELSEAVGERLQIIQAAVRRRLGFLPWAVESAVNDLVGLCSAAGPSDADDGSGGNGNGSNNIEKGLLLLGGDGSSGSTSTSRSSSY